MGILSLSVKITQGAVIAIMALCTTAGMNLALGVSSTVLSTHSEFQNNACEEPSKDSISFAFSTGVLVSGILQLALFFFKSASALSESGNLSRMTLAEIRESRRLEDQGTVASARHNMNGLLMLVVLANVIWTAVFGAQYFLTIYPTCSGQIYDYSMIQFVILLVSSVSDSALVYWIFW